MGDRGAARRTVNEGNEKTVMGLAAGLLVLGGQFATAVPLRGDPDSTAATNPRMRRTTNYITLK